MKKIDQESINTLRFLSIDEVQAANSGHPGLPLGTAPLMYTIWDRFMKVNPKDPSWFDRDRFVLRQAMVLPAICHASFGWIQGLP